MNHNRISSFTSIRAIWAFSIVLCHIYLLYDDVIEFGIFNFLTHGGFGVTNFFVLSGFLVFMHYETNYDMGAKVIDSIKYAFYHVRKWYWLHIVTMVIGIILNYKTSYLLYKVIVNIVLIQSWRAPYNYSLNGVAWYLSCLFLLYLITPQILYLNKIIRKNLKICVLLLVFLTALNFIIGNVMTGFFLFSSVIQRRAIHFGGCYIIL